MNNKNKISMIDSGIVFAFAIFATAIASIILSFMMVGEGSFLQDPKTRQWISGLVAQLIFVAVVVSYSISKKKNTFVAIGGKNLPKLWQWGVALVLSFATMCFMLPVQTALSNLLLDLGLTPPAGILVENDTDFVLALFIAAVMPAVCEEVVYRGFVTNSMAKPGSKIDVKAIVYSSLVFAVMHMSPWQTLHPFVLGGIIAVVYLATRSIWIAMFMHFANNAIVLFTGYFTKGAFDAFVVANWWWVMLLALAVIVGCIWLFAKNAKAVDEGNDESLAVFNQEKNKSLAYYTAGIVFCLFMWVFVLIG